MASIPDFTESELWTVGKALEERYRESVQPDLVETELRLNPHSTELVPCPALYWQRGKAHFVIAKVGERRYRAQFFYRVHQMYGTGIDTFDDIAECTVTLLQVQADHAAKEAKAQEKEADKKNSP
jgi:hypothetical protein